MATSSKVRGRKGKLGKNKHRIAAYYADCRYQWNRARRLVKHLHRYAAHSVDKPATDALKALKAAMPLRMSRDFEAQYPS